MKRAPFIAGLTAASAAPAFAQSLTNLNVGTAVDSPTQLPLYLGLTHTFKDRGLNVSALGFRGDTEVAQALAGNSIDIALASSSGLLNLVTANQGVIGFYGGFNQADFSWLAQPAIKSWRDMKGKTLGVSTFGSLTDLITRYVLQRNHLVPDKDVQIIQAGGSPSAFAARAYDEAMPDFDERGRIPEKSMPVFWQLSIAQGIVKAPLPEKDLIDKHFIDTFNSWAPRG